MKTDLKEASDPEPLKEEAKVVVQVHTEKYFEETVLTKDEEETESMISLMTEMRNMQMMSKNLTDEQRRKNAEEMMMKLAAMIDIGDSDGDHSDS